MNKFSLAFVITSMAFTLLQSCSHGPKKPTHTALKSFNPPQTTVTNQFVGMWSKKESVQWMQDPVVETVSTLEIKVLENESLYMTLQINGHHSCRVEGEISINGDSFTYDSASPASNLSLSNTDQDDPCRFEGQLEKQNSMVRIVAVSPACKADCGAGASIQDHVFSKIEI